MERLKRRKEEGSWRNCKRVQTRRSYGDAVAGSTSMVPLLKSRSRGLGGGKGGEEGVLMSEF